MVTKRLTKETATGGEIRMTTEELVKQICKEQGMSVAKLAAALGQSRQNFYKKLQRDTLTAQEWQEAAKVGFCPAGWNQTWSFREKGETHGTAADGKCILTGKGRRDRRTV